MGDRVTIMMVMSLCVVERVRENKEVEDFNVVSISKRDIRSIVAV